MPLGRTAAWGYGSRPDGIEETRHHVMARALVRTIPELAPELDHVVNAFDPWARDRGEYYRLEWKPRRGAESAAAFKEAR